MSIIQNERRIVPGDETAWWAGLGDDYCTTVTRNRRWAAFVLFERGGSSWKQIATAMGCSKRTAQRLVSACRHDLKEIVGDSETREHGERDQQAKPAAEVARGE